MKPDQGAHCSRRVPPEAGGMAVRRKIFPRGTEDSLRSGTESPKSELWTRMSETIGLSANDTDQRPGAFGTLRKARAFPREPHSPDPLDSGGNAKATEKHGKNAFCFPNLSETKICGSVCEKNVAGNGGWSAVFPGKKKTAPAESLHRAHRQSPTRIPTQRPIRRR